MWEKLIEKFLCNHKWKNHAKNSYTNGEFNEGRIERFTEILICDKCGKIKKINY